LGQKLVVKSKKNNKPKGVLVKKGKGK